MYNYVKLEAVISYIMKISDILFYLFNILQYASPDCSISTHIGLKYRYAVPAKLRN